MNKKIIKLIVIVVIIYAVVVSITLLINKQAANTGKTTNAPVVINQVAPAQPAVPENDADLGAQTSENGAFLR
jgi:flagellar basal body-associated protein FliL